MPFHRVCRGLEQCLSHSREVDGAGSASWVNGRPQMNASGAYGMVKIAMGPDLGKKAPAECERKMICHPLLFITPHYNVQFSESGMEPPMTTDKQTRIYISGLYCSPETVILRQGPLRVQIHVLRNLELILQCLHTPVFPSTFLKVQPLAPTPFE